jgi:hypothetical protein
LAHIQQIKQLAKVECIIEDFMLPLPSSKTFSEDEIL